MVTTLEFQGEQLTSLSGPGLKGLVNVGSSCYMNAVLQVIYTLPEVNEKYYTSSWAQSLINNYTASDPPSLDLSVQLVKLGNALLSDRYTDAIVERNDEKEDENFPILKNQVAPRMLKYIIGQGETTFVPLFCIPSIIEHIYTRSPRIFFLPPARCK